MHLGAENKTVYFILVIVAACPGNGNRLIIHTEINQTR